MTARRPLLIASLLLAPLLPGAAACQPAPAAHAGAGSGPPPAAGAPRSAGVGDVEPLQLPDPGGPTVVGLAPADGGDPDDGAAAALLREEPPDAEPGAAGPDATAMRVLPGGVGVEDIVMGSGVQATAGMKLTVHYVGRLEDGSEFDSSRTRGRPFTYNHGAGMVIAGWEDGIEGMRVGGVRRLLIPPHKGYGSRKMAKIPADSILEFEVELLDAQVP